MQINTEAVYDNDVTLAPTSYNKQLSFCRCALWQWWRLLVALQWPSSLILPSRPNIHLTFSASAILVWIDHNEVSNQNGHMTFQTVRTRSSWGVDGGLVSELMEYYHRFNKKKQQMNENQVHKLLLLRLPPPARPKLLHSVMCYVISQRGIITTVR